MPTRNKHTPSGEGRSGLAYTVYGEMIQFWSMPNSYPEHGCGLQTDTGHGTKIELRPGPGATRNSGNDAVITWCFNQEYKVPPWQHHIEYWETLMNYSYAAERCPGRSRATEIELCMSTVEQRYTQNGQFNRSTGHRTRFSLLVVVSLLNILTDHPSTHMLLGAW